MNPTWLLLALLLGPLPMPDPTPRQGLSPYFSVFRTPNAYEGPYICTVICYRKKADGGLGTPELRDEDPDPGECIRKLQRRGPKECPRG